MDGRVAQGPLQASREEREGARRHDPRAEGGQAAARLASAAIGVGLVLVALLVYTATHPFRFYDHFEWQAQAFLEGQVAIRYPVEATADSQGNWFFQDVLPVPSSDGVPRGLIPFPPLPALVLVPFVAAWGRAADGQAIFAIIGAIDVGIAWWVLGRLPIRRWARLSATIFFGFGTVLWYAAQIGTTWYQAHVLAVGLALLAVGLAIGADPDAAMDEDDLPDDGPEPSRAHASSLSRVIELIRGVDGRQFLAGFLFGLACTARLTMIFAAPFFVLVGGGGTWLRRGWSAALGAAIPIAALVLFNLVSMGHFFNPAYDYLYHLEAGFYTALNYNPAWGIEDPRYLPQNIGIMFFSTPAIAPNVVPSTLGGGPAVCTDPGAIRSLFDATCPLALPRDIGMSVILTSPAYLLVVGALRRYGRNRLVSGAFLAVFIVALVNLMHFSQGWVQFGYRFSLDFLPWALVLVAIGLDRLRSTAAVALGLVLVAVSIAVNGWGVVIANQLGW
ncbi:MAG TPA: hypothetical protein VK697_05675 [Methylomirabilota bacterium]|nr:hypothetical protein [Methylomirabilota bacterium]